MRGQVLVCLLVLLLSLLQSNLLTDYTVVVPLLKMILDYLLAINGLLILLTLRECHHFLKRTLLNLCGLCLCQVETWCLGLEGGPWALRVFSERWDLLRHHVLWNNSWMLRLIICILRILGEVGRFLDLAGTAALINKGLVSLFLPFQLAPTLRDSKARIIGTWGDSSSIQNAVP